MGGAPGLAWSSLFRRKSLGQSHAPAVVSRARSLIDNRELHSTTEGCQNLGRDDRAAMSHAKIDMQPKDVGWKTGPRTQHAIRVERGASAVVWLDGADLDSDVLCAEMIGVQSRIS